MNKTIEIAPGEIVDLGNGYEAVAGELEDDGVSEVQLGPGLKLVSPHMRATKFSVTIRKKADPE